ncbi:MAG TPA: hypothetical protein VN253_29830 [Kofleriaceae bacterium]|nr:hypothetical protein [Kofleriaceae bacterium]
MSRAIAFLGVLVLAGVAGCTSGPEVSRTLGARCDHAAECDDRCLPPAAFPGGFCSTSCERNADCPSSASCVDAEAGVCLFDCVDDGDCKFLGDGWRCLELSLREDPARRAMVCSGVTP